MRWHVLVAATAAALPWPAAAQDEAVARSLSATCTHCHGAGGRSVTRDIASLAGLPKPYIVSQMKSFKDGTRPATVMGQLAKGYTDAQIDAVAGYFSRLPK